MDRETLINTRTGATLGTVEVARSHRERMVGLLGRTNLATDTGMRFDGTNSIHMVFMRFAIDVLYLDRASRVVKLVHDLRPWRFSAARRAKVVIELPAGTLRALDIRAGDQIEGRPSDAPMHGALPESSGARSAYWWAALALLCSLAALGVGFATGIEVRPVLRAAAFVTICWAAAEDFRTRRLRNVLTAPALVLALAGAEAPQSALVGALVAPLPFLAIAIPMPGSMGMGDVKLAAVAGALAGPSGLLLWWMGTALAGLVLALVALVRGGMRATLAYGPALVAGLGAVLW